MKVLFLLSSLRRAGAQRQLVTTAQGLAARGHAVSIATLRGEAPLDSEAGQSGVIVLHLGSNRPFGGVTGRLRYPVALLRNRPDIVYAYLPAAQTTASLFGFVHRRSRVVWGIRDSGVDTSGLPWKDQTVVRLADRLARLPARIVTNSHAALDAYERRGYPRTRLHVIPNGIDLERFTADDAERVRIRDELGFAPTDFVVCCMARIDPMKGHDVLLDAFSRASQRVARLRLLVVGDHTPDWSASYLNEARRLGIADRVLVLPAQSLPEQIYHASDALVSASLYGEGFSNVIGEAMACGLPVVTTDVGDGAHIVGPHGLVVPPGDANSLSRAIERVATDEDDPSLRLARRRRIGELYSIEALVRRTESVLQDVLGDAAFSRAESGARRKPSR